MKYLKVGVSRRQYSEVYLEVPDEALPDGVTLRTSIPTEILRAACLATISEGEWDTDRELGVLDWESYEEVPEGEAKNYARFPWNGARS